MTDQMQRVIGKALAKKILLVQQSVANIPKRGHNQAFNYDYVLSADAVEFIRKAVNEQGLIVVPVDVQEVKPIAGEVGKGNQLLTEVAIRYRIVDPESGEHDEWTWRGQGADAWDKGIYKAYTGCFKYALMQYFMVAGDDADPENERRKKGDAQDDRRPQSKGRPQSSAASAKPSAPGSSASASKIKFIQDLMKSEWIPGAVRTAVSNWLAAHQEKQDWSDSDATKVIDNLKKFWPIASEGKSRPVSDKQLAFIERLAKSSSLPKGLVTKVGDEVNRHRSDAAFKITSAQASAMIECLQYFIDMADKKAKAASLPPGQVDTEQRDADEFAKIEDLLKVIDAEFPKHDPPGGDIQVTAFTEWRKTSSWTVGQCEAWLRDIRRWPLKDGGK